MRWYVKAAIQLGLSKLPGGTTLNEVLSRHFGEQQNVTDQVLNRLTVLTPLLLKAKSHVDLGSGIRAVEIGTGWTPVMPILLGLHGVETVTFDVNRYLTVENVRETLRAMRSRADDLAESLSLPRQHVTSRLEAALSSRGALSDVLAPLRIRYEAPVNTTNLPVESGSAQLYLSNLVFAHIPPKALPMVLEDMHRILGEGGVALHRIRMTDELVGGDLRYHEMNFLRYPGWFWERFANTKIKYNNRIRCSQFKAAFEKAGLQLLDSLEDVDERALDALRAGGVATEFRDMSLQDLATATMVGAWQKPGLLPLMSQISTLVDVGPSAQRQQDSGSLELDIRTR